MFRVCFYQNVFDSLLLVGWRNEFHSSGLVQMPVFLASFSRMAAQDLRQRRHGPPTFLRFSMLIKTFLTVYGKFAPSSTFLVSSEVLWHATWAFPFFTKRCYWKAFIVIMLKCPFITEFNLYITWGRHVLNQKTCIYPIKQWKPSSNRLVLFNGMLFKGALRFAFNVYIVQSKNLSYNLYCFTLFEVLTFWCYIKAVNMH